METRFRGSTKDSQSSGNRVWVSQMYKSICEKGADGYQFDRKALVGGQRVTSSPPLAVF